MWLRYKLKIWITKSEDSNLEKTKTCDSKGKRFTETIKKNKTRYTRSNTELGKSDYEKNKFWVQPMIHEELRF